jgi:pimeloyl-ACP methyl ester carboxylesterase
VHGWPGSFLEVGPLLPYLLSPPNNSVRAFHVIAPSIPGFAFSPAPIKPGFGYIEAAHAFDALMQQLNYPKYVMQAGDAGAIIMRYQAHLYPNSVVSGLNNFWVVSPSNADLAKYHAGDSSDDEVAIIERMDYFLTHLWGYGQIQQTRPLRLAYGLTDSPLGLAMWIYDALWPSAWDVEVFTPKEIITWTMMHWLQGPYGGLSIYKQGGPMVKTVCC